jgi:hypothetical protein
LCFELNQIALLVHLTRARKTNLKLETRNSKLF